MLKIAHLFERICHYAARLAGLLLFVLTFVVLYDIIGRQFFNTGSVALQELEWHIHGAIVMLGFGYAYTRNSHVRIDIVSQSFSDRTKMKLEIVGIVLLLTPFLLVILWYGVDFAHRSFVRGESSSGGLGLDHRWIIKSAVPLSALIALMGAWSVLIRSVAALRGQNVSPYRKEPLWNS
ncbi:MULTISPECIES: TRAP transporter small permease subunit [Rhodobacterales]|uniref:TRAP transporter small permease protein n=3 Tax=Rhodobacterales TaxID=204455 RepID=A0A0P1IXB1_9RHOB|nr:MULTISPECIES: TRAP transporter small permease subunit [Rhodobacterales]CUH58749.1 TRAP-type mannitol/chloroaromatic compound transport system, small permease component [Thalassobacter stenotrophicus]CUI93949.1 TRAP-type mannitol/chloroaromatic compound transport system, small permease component [Cognatishimia activa]CUK25810.1 TRAP-type mannitol/chloroaromatic compound transport system, small permease component [Cognatishimia activa]SHJ38937.1 TRAP-type mannitol/chloroaromatic compound trans